MNPDAQETAPLAVPTNLRAPPSGDEQQKRSQWESGLDYGADTADGQPSGQGSDKTTLVTIAHHEQDNAGATYQTCREKRWNR
jgi:hypothetical protein